MIRPSPLKKRTKKRNNRQVCTDSHWHHPHDVAIQSLTTHGPVRAHFGGLVYIWHQGLETLPDMFSSTSPPLVLPATYSHITTLGAAQVPNLPHPSSLPRSSRSRLDSNHGPCRMLGALIFDTRSMFYVQSSIGHVDEGCCRFQKHLLHLTQYGPEGFWHPSNPMGLSWHLAPRQHEGT